MCYPHLELSLSLEYSQFVLLSYRILIGQNVDSLFFTRLMINDVEHDVMRDGSGPGCVSNSATDAVWLEKGDYEIRLEYQT